MLRISKSRIARHSLTLSSCAKQTFIRHSSTDKQETSQRISSATGEYDPVLLDTLFMKNKPSKKLYYQKGSFSKRQEFANTQQIDKFHVLDTNLSNFKSSTPVNFNYYLRNLKDLKNANQLPYNFGQNQMILDEGSEISTFLKNIIWEFNAPIRFSFGYGSKIFSQGAGSTNENSQTDLIFAVSYPSHWHSMNLSQFPEHYSSLRHFGSDFVSKIQDMGAGVYFNPFVKMDIKDNNKGNSLLTKTNVNLKYGVISMDRLVDDLINWDNMYVSGRLHKPVAVIRNTPAISLLNQYNLTNAVKLSILLLDQPTIKESELYYKIASLSYTGDPRLKYGGEHISKISNIVNNQFKEFRKLYLPLLQNYFPNTIQQLDSDDAADISFKVNLSPEGKARLLVDLPKSFRKKLYSQYTGVYNNEFGQDVLAKNVFSDPKPTFAETATPETNHLKFAELNMFNNFAELDEIPTKDWEYLSNSFKSQNSSFVKAIAGNSDSKLLVNNLEQALINTISTPAMTQSIKGIFTAGLGKSFWYAYEKRQKYNKSKTKNE